MVNQMFRKRIEILLCPHCRKHIRHDIMGSPFIPSSPWSDGFSGIPLDGILMCPWCHELVWMRDMEWHCRHIPDERIRGLDKERPWWKFWSPKQSKLATASNCLYGNQASKKHIYDHLNNHHHSLRREVSLRLRLWWISNHPQRKASEHQMNHKEHENIEQLLFLLNPKQEDEVMLRIEILRRMGSFSQVIEWSNYLRERGKYEFFPWWQSMLALEKCNLLIHFPPSDFLTIQTPPLFHEVITFSRRVGDFIDMPRDWSKDPQSPMPFQPAPLWSDHAELSVRKREISASSF